jgi:methylenetetrahydrofolate--tRNA-(uracil-5-)-methyltransferase
VGLLKKELRLLGSLTMAAADAARVPAGQALAVDREAFSGLVTAMIEENPLIELVREKAPLSLLDGRAQGNPLVVAAGPLASEDLAERLAGLTGAENLHFYDALAPIVTGESLDLGRIFRADRYGQGPGGDYLNCPLDQGELETFMAALTAADRLRPRPFEEERYFEGCLPIEVMAARGPRTLCFGPMKPVGLVDPGTGRRPAAVVQLRREDLAGTHWNMVGFQTRLTRAAQEEVFRLIPGLGRARFARHGAIHRNTYLEAPRVLDPFQRLLARPAIFAAGQISGVEGYVESAAQGLWAGENASRVARGLAPVLPPRASALGSLLWHLGQGNASRVFSPSNVNFGLFPPCPSVPRREQAARRLAAAEGSWEPFLGEIGYARLGR